MARKRPSKKAKPAKPAASPKRAARPSALVDTRSTSHSDTGHLSTGSRPAKPTTVFVSHSHEDGGHQTFRRLIADLRAVPELKLWLSEEQIHDGEPLLQAVQAAIHAADYVLHVVSARSVRSPWTNHEAMMALVDQASRQRAKLVVVIIDDATIERFDPVNSFVYNRLDLTHDYDEGLHALLSALLARHGPLLGRFDIDASYNRQTIIQVSHWVGQQLVAYFAEHPHELKTMNRRLFEELVAELFHGFGYAVELTQKTRDGGRDVIAVKQAEAHVKYLIECKRPDPGRAVGIQPVRELYGVKTDEGASKAILATTAHFSRDAVLFFERHKWELEPRDYDGIMEWIKAYRK